MIYCNGDIYNGEWKKDNFNGFGKFINSDGTYYEGFWKNDKKNGKGNYIVT